jgi:hypothetical protein
MNKVSWAETLEGKTVDSAWNHFKTTLMESVEKNFPKCGTGTRLRNPWMTREILCLIRKKRRKWRVTKLSRSAEDMREYQEIEKETAKKIRNAKRKLEKDLVSGKDKNNRKFTRYIKSKSKSRTTVGPLKDKNKKLVTGEREVAIELNTFFTSFFTQEDQSSIPEPEQETVNKRMEPVQISQQQIQNKIRKLRKGAAPGPEGITPGLLQKLEDAVVKPLEIIFNIRGVPRGDAQDACAFPPSPG